MNVRRHVVRALLRSSDWVDARYSLKGPLTPPKELISRYGGGSYHEIGLEFFRYLLEFCEPERDAKLLDIGCGVGRMAIPWTAYLTDRGSYDGFDIMPEGVEWCRSAVTSRRPNFRFHHADIRNSFYNPGGVIEPTDYRFAFPDGSFDVAFSTSVLTHLPPNVIANYLAETARVLRPGRRSLHTFFLLDDVSTRQVRAGLAALNFQFQMAGFMTTDARFPEAAIAVPQASVEQMYAAAGLRIREVHHGAWSGRANGLSGQDLIVAERLRSADTPDPTDGRHRSPQHYRSVTPDNRN